MTIFSGNLVSLYECGNNCKSGLSPIINPYSCINHVLAISIDILVVFICLFMFVYRPSSSKTLALPDSQRYFTFQISSAILSVALGLIYFGLAILLLFCAFGDEKYAETNIDALHEPRLGESACGQRHSKVEASGSSGDMLLKEKLSKEKEKGTLNTSVLKTVFLWQLKAILVSGFFALIKALTLATGPLFLRDFILVAEGKETFRYEGYALIAGLFLGKCFKSLSERQWSFRTRLIGLQIRSLLTAAIYQKHLKLSNAAKTNHSPGQITNYVMVDAYRIGEFPYWIHQTWTIGLQICLAFLILYYAMGTAAIAAKVVIVLTMLSNYPAAKLQHKYLAKLMLAHNRRPKAMVEALTNMEVLKLYAWKTHFKNAVEKNRYAKKTRDAEGLNQAISISTTRISWDSSSLKPTLNDINLVVHCGEKIAVCGEVGSGKLSLIAAILGEFPDINGIVQVYGEIAYVSQTAWIQTGTIQENILFGCTRDQNRYEKVLEKCSLKKDLEMLPFGDCTIIGERGVNLSGGQKQRVQLARALYKDADIYLLDDPFSAVDAHTTTSLFNEYVMGALARKTVLLVTHQVDFLPAFDSILLVSEGKIVEAANYDQLLASSQQFQNLVNAHKVTPDSNLQSEFGFEEPKTPKEEIKKIYTERHQRETLGDQLIKEEERETGDTCLKPYIQYLKQSNGILYLFLSIIVHCVFIIAKFVQSLWLAAHLQESSVSRLELISVYSLIGCGMLIFLLLRSYLAVLLGIKTSIAIFSKLMTSVFRAPISFYDSTPLGRILSWVSSDMNIVDLELAFIFTLSIGNTMNAYFSFGVLAFLTWPILFVILLMVIVTIILQGLYFASAKELMRIEGTTKSSVASYLAESIAGAVTIRAFGEE
ncbi:hypothetical protein RHGRI_000787 [Rhododendron griersonianum]|uniref:ABC-type xenobiotic transporter n=1 Tax=Rhododendron griersonianum TaxID=479676 RepID=A0AAV6LKE9_9ERIC|nr:hypothetical protein RHGRI_000787 [Rhododendron griersonianum]